MSTTRARSSSSMTFSRDSERTRAISAISSTGLVRKSSAPTSRPRTRSAGWSSAVTITTGRCSVAGSDLRRRQTSNPSIPGIITSSSTMSQRPSRHSSSASKPLVAEITSKYSAVSRASNNLMLGSKSSTISTRAVMRFDPLTYQPGRRLPFRETWRPKSASRDRPRIRLAGFFPRRPSSRRPSRRSRESTLVPRRP